MKIKYMAFDGKLFNSEDECSAYETNINGVCDIYNRVGERTHFVEFGFIIHIKTLDGASYFINLADKQGSSYDGITYSSIGWFYWDQDIKKYVLLDNSVINAIKAIEME